MPLRYKGKVIMTLCESDIENICRLSFHLFMWESDHSIPGFAVIAYTNK